MLVGVEAVTRKGAITLVSEIFTRFPLQVLLVLLYVCFLVAVFRDPDLRGNDEVALLPTVGTTSPGIDMVACNLKFRNKKRNIFDLLFCKTS